MELATLREQYTSKINEAKALAAVWKGKETEMPEEEAKKIDTLLGEADVLKARIELLKRIDCGESFVTDPQASPAAHLGWRDAGPMEGMPNIDGKAWREIEVKTAAGTKTIRYHVPLAVQKAGYDSAFEAYLRKGLGDIGPQDRKTLTEGTDSAGGFLVPPDYHAELIKKIAESAAIRPNARVVQTSRDLAQWPKLSYAADDQYTSGVRLTWAGESPASASVHRVTDPIFGLYQIPVHTAMASMPLSNNLIEDSAFDVIGVSSDLLAEAFALGEESAFITGDGVAEPLGIIPEGATLTTSTTDYPAYVPSGTAATLTADGIIDLAYALPEQYERNAKWYMRKSTEKVIRKLKDDENNYLWPVVPVVGNFGVPPRELLGFPVVRAGFVPAIESNTYPIIFGDMRGYMIVDRVGFSIQRLNELYAETNITLLLARKRVGGQLVEPWRLKVQKVAAS